MSFFFPEVEKKYVYKRKGTQDDPYVPISESLKVVNSRVILKEVPDLFTKVTVKDSNGNFLYETTSLTPNANEYRVDYSLGIVYFNSSNEGKEFTFDYRGVGLVAFPTSRIWTRESNGEIVETLQELIDTITITVNEIKQEQSHLADYVKHPAFAVTTGSANAYEVTLNPAPIAYEDGFGIVVAIHADSTGASTLNVNGLGAIPIKKSNGNDVTNLKANGVYTLHYFAGNFILQGEGGEGTAQPQHVLSGQTFTNDEGLQTGEMVDRGAMIITPTTSDQPIPAGYHNGSGVVKGDPDLIPANIKKGVNIFGAVGTLSPFHTVPDGSIGFAANIIDKNAIGYDYYYDKNTGNFIKLTGSLGNYIEKKIYDKNGTLLSTQNIGSFPSQTRVARKTKSGIFVSTISNVYLINDNGTILRSAPINGNIYNDNLIYDSANDVYVGMGVAGSYSGKAVLMTFTGLVMNFTSAVGFDGNTILNILQDGVIHGIRPASSTSIYQFICIKNGSSWDMSVVTTSNLSSIPVFLSHLARLYGGMEK